MQHKNQMIAKTDMEYEFCPRCEANLTLQKGYCNTLPYWICRGCGEMLINPAVEGDIAWFCDSCGAMLNIQKGFREDCLEWKCTECGHVNVIDESVLYQSEDEYQAACANPYSGLASDEMLELSAYQEMEFIDGREDVILVRHRETGEYFVKKLLTSYNREVYEYLLENPVRNMPAVAAVYEGNGCLIVIEEYVEGKTLADILSGGVLSEERTIAIAAAVCRILSSLHGLHPPIVHRDVKPSNVMITADDQVYLLDMNVAKWYDPEKKDDTQYMGTRYYAAPEQVGYGLSASSPKTDIYALGMTMNVMMTGEFPKTRSVSGRLGEIIAKCIKLDADDRYSDAELLQALELMRN